MKFKRGNRAQKTPVTVVIPLINILNCVSIVLFFLKFHQAKLLFREVQIFFDEMK